MTKCQVFPHSSSVKFNNLVDMVTTRKFPCKSPPPPLFFFSSLLAVSQLLTGQFIGDLQISCFPMSKFLVF